MDEPDVVEAPKIDLLEKHIKEWVGASTDTIAWCFQLPKAVVEAVLNKYFESGGHRPPP